MKFIQPLVVLFSALSAFASSQPGPDTYVRVLFSDGEVIYYNFGECYPYQLDDGNGATAVEATWSQSTFCRSYSSFDCSGTEEFELPVPAHTLLINAADFAKVTGNSANCTALPLPVIG